jgi:uncharacterized protein YjbI with pentapeptide repeats
MLRNVVPHWCYVGNVWLATCLATASVGRADIFRWDNGQLIPNTAGITPGPRVQLYNRQLEYARLEAVDLADSNFSFTNMTHSDLAGSNFTNARLAGANLTDANLAGANLTNADLDYATLSGANLTGTIFSGATFNYTTILGGLTKEQFYSTANYQQKDLRGIRFGLSLCLCGTPLNDLTGWDLSGQDLTNANLGLSILRDVDFAGAIVTGTSLAGTSNGFTKQQLYSTRSYQQRNLRGIDLSGNNLSGWDLRGQDLSSANLGSATLTGADLSAADLRGAIGSNFAHAAVKNLIRPEGTVLGLELANSDQLVVRDDNGIPGPPRSDLNWTPRPRSPIAITVHEHFVMSDSGTLRFIIEPDPWNSLISFEPGIPVQLGGTLDLTFAADMDVRTQIGRTIHLFNWTGVRPSGEFAIRRPYLWDVSRLYTTGEVTLIAIPEPPAIVIMFVVVIAYSLPCRSRRI